MIYNYNRGCRRSVFLRYLLRTMNTLHWAMAVSARRNAIVLYNAKVQFGLRECWLVGTTASVIGGNNILLLV